MSACLVVWRLLQGVVHFHRLEMVRLEQCIGEAERRLVDSPLAVGYVDQQQKLHQLKVRVREGRREGGREGRREEG